MKRDECSLTPLKLLSYFMLLFFTCWSAFCADDAAATSLTPEIGLVSGNVDYHTDGKIGWAGRSDWPINHYIQENEHFIINTTKTYNEIDRFTFQTETCTSTSGEGTDIYWQMQNSDTNTCVQNGTNVYSLDEPTSCSESDTESIRLCAGNVTGGSPRCDLACQSNYNYCLGGPPAGGAAGAVNQEGLKTCNSSTLLQLNCVGANAAGAVHVVAFPYIENENAMPSPDDFLLNGRTPDSSWVSFAYYDIAWWEYRWYGEMEWFLPINQPCGSTFSLAPSVNGFGDATISTIEYLPCIEITKFSGTDTTFDPSAGGSINMSATIVTNNVSPGTITDSRVNWVLTIAGRYYYGEGTNVSVNWNGKDSNDKIVPAGTYTGMLTATTADGRCSDQREFKISIKPACDLYDHGNCCMLQVHFGSTADVVSGNLYHSQTLFTIPNSKLIGDFTLSNNSLYGYSGPLGVGWTHSYNISIADNGDTIVVMEGDGKRGVLYNKGANYAPVIFRINPA
ncbi:MAG: DUF6531 domain-containing protein [Nitrospiraceae bacterium]|nr:DUF6531 domain-containing protein [Nitrospiraceae bacterium]